VSFGLGGLKLYYKKPYPLTLILAKVLPEQNDIFPEDRSASWWTASRRLNGTLKKQGLSTAWAAQFWFRRSLCWFRRSF